MNSRVIAATNEQYLSGFATTGSNTFSGSQTINGNISASGDISASNLYITNAIYAYELHTIIESSSVIYSSGSNNIGDAQNDVLTITGSLYQTGSTSFSELSGSLAAFSASLNTRIGTISVGTLSASIYQTDATQSNNITNVSSSLYTLSSSVNLISGAIATTDNTQTTNITAASASAWGAYTSASAYSASLAASITGSSSNVTALSQSLYFTDTTQSVNITQASASAWGAFQSASSYSGSFYTTINNLSSSIATTDTLFAKLGSANRFNGNQEITGSLTVSGDVTAYYSSDERLKDNIALISNPIEKVQQLRGVEFDWNDKSLFKAGRHDYGVIAQDVQKVLPELVKETHTGYLGVDYDKMISLLIEVVKEQEKRIKDLENKIGS